MLGYCPGGRQCVYPQLCAVVMAQGKKLFVSLFVCDFVDL